MVSGGDAKPSADQTAGTAISEQGEHTGALPGGLVRARRQ
jgi:hypothetical protein